MADAERGATSRDYAIGLARAFGGANIFALPLLMTMEMWWLGFYLDPLRLALFLVVNFAVLVGLSRFGGFEWRYEERRSRVQAGFQDAVGPR